MTRREAVLAALRDAAETGVSGEVLATRLGVSRVAIGKHVSALRAAGYEIAAEPGVGYRLLAPPDAPIPAEIAPLLSDASWMHLTGGGETASTNDDARALARAEAPEGTVVLASRQTAGRGRLGRTWESPRGGAYFSLVLRPQVAPSEIAPLALVMGLGIARGLSKELGVEVALKWPNDVYLSGGKLAGVLLEMAAETDRVNWVVAGVGLNLRRAQGFAPAEKTACLDDAVPGVAIATAVAVTLDGIAEAYAEWLRGGFSAMHSEYEARLMLIGSEVVVRDISGNVKAAGLVTGVDIDGRLLVSGVDGVQAVVAGEVTLRDPAE
jgi:BirA family transcriptional regulator, biotin operon repressor / biotin---[acetyl-CoA-carboxylase] ligase